MLARQEYYLGMRRGFSHLLVALVVLVSGALAQGPPPSVTSPGFGGHKGGGPPASVTSPGFGKIDNGRVFFRPPMHHPFSGTRTPRHHNFSPNAPFGGAVYAVPVPYYVPVETTEPVDDTMEQMRPTQYLGGPTLFDRRGDGVAAPVAPVEPAPRPVPEREAEAAPPKEPAPVAEQPQTLLVFKDGHHIEVQNYAIVGDMLYDMTPGHSRRVLLAELDLDATSKQNDERGIDFRLPPRPKAQ